MKIASALIQCMMRTGNGWSRRGADDLEGSSWIGTVFIVSFPDPKLSSRTGICWGFNLWPNSGRLFFHDRSDGLDDHRSHLEGIAAIFDVMPTRNPIKISVDRPDVAIRILMDQQPHRPVQPGSRI